jgi:glutamate dehydrogenase (NADP+)
MLDIRSHGVSGEKSLRAADICNAIMEQVDVRNPNEPEFRQAVYEVVDSVARVVVRHRKYHDARILERLIEPERVIQFRVPWQDDDGRIQVSRGWRVQYSSTRGPYKGGLRFHPSVNLSVLKFLGFEQILKNSLTTLPLGGGKGGSDFDPKGKSDDEVMRFCQSFMTELARHIGPDTDVPAGDIGVGVREIGYLFGQYKRLQNKWHGVLTGKAFGWGGSRMRPEATGYGVVYFAQEMLKQQDESLAGKTCIISGSGNVSLHVAEQLLKHDAKVIALSDSGGCVHDADGIDEEKLAWVRELKEKRRGRMAEYVEQYKNAEYHESDSSTTIWQLKADCAFPCATQNELKQDDARRLIKSGVKLVCEGANMPATADAMHELMASDVLYGPAKAANAGGVAVSGLEMMQNSMRSTWTHEEVDRRLREIMKSIHDACIEAAAEYDLPGNYVHGANIAGFVRVADGMLEQGVV